MRCFCLSLSSGWIRLCFWIKLQSDALKSAGQQVANIKMNTPEDKQSHFRRPVPPVQQPNRSGLTEESDRFGSYTGFPIYILKLVYIHTYIIFFTKLISYKSEGTRYSARPSTCPLLITNIKYLYKIWILKYYIKICILERASFFGCDCEVVLLSIGIS